MIGQDRTILCKDCGRDFLFTVGEQEFYERKGFVNVPARCKTCRDTRKRATLGRSLSSAMNGTSAGASAGLSLERTLHAATCSSCGANTHVPFRPAIGKPVYCRDCYFIRSHRSESTHRHLGL